MARKTNIEINGSKYFRLTATIGRDNDGKLIRKQFYGISKQDAENKRDEYINGIKNGLNKDFKDAVTGKIFHSWLFEIVRVNTDIKPSSFQRYEGIYRNYIIKSSIYGVKLCDLKSIQIQRYYNTLFDEGKSSNVIKNLNKLLKTFFNYAVDEGYLLKNPCKKLVIPGDKEKEVLDIDEQEVEFFSDEDIDLLKKTLEGHRLKCLILLALGTGLRQGEILALKWTDIKGNELLVQRNIKRVNIINADGSKEYKPIIQYPKTKNSVRKVPIPSKLLSVIEEHKNQQEIEKKKAGDSYEDNKYIFTTELGKFIDDSNLRKIYKKILIKSGVEYKKFHALRHTYATKLFERDVPLKTVSELLGHSDISITAEIYTHVIPKKKINAAEELNDLF